MYQIIPVAIVLIGYSSIVVYMIYDHCKTRRIREMAQKEIEQRSLTREQELRHRANVRRYYGYGREHDYYR